MTGTIILTGANGSLGIHAAEQLLKEHQEFTAIFTVRNAAESDTYTQSLREVITRYPNAKATILQVDLANLSAVHEFAHKISSAIAARKYPPIASIICNAAYWNLISDSELTEDGYDKTLQIDHISHVALVLRLIGSFASEGRVVLLSSISHYRKPNAMTSLLPEIPDDMDQVNHPLPDTDKKGRGFQRYASAKLVITTWMYALDRYLQQNPKFKNITVVAVNPGGLGDSRCFTTNAPRSLGIAQKLVLKPFMSIINLADRNFRSSAVAGKEIAEFAVGKAHPGERGYFTMLTKGESDPVTMDNDVQQKVWNMSLAWAHITKDNAAFKDGLS